MPGSKSARRVGTKEGRESRRSPETQNPARRLAGFCVDAACELLLLGLARFGEAVHDAFELHRRGVRGGAPRRTGEGERTLRTWIRDVHHDDLARLQLREQDLLGQQVLDVTLDRPP